MSQKQWPCSPTAFATALLLTFASSQSAAIELGGSTPLLAGQHQEVGTVTVRDNNGTLEVVYQITDADWCLQHVHADAGEDVDDIPTTPGRNSNPRPGQFKVNQALDCASETTVTLGATPQSSFVVAAHAEVDSSPRCSSRAVLYGTSRGQSNTGKARILELDVLAEHCGDSVIARFDDPAPGNNNSPNGLAYDAASQTLYFSVQPGQASDNELYSVDLGGTLPATSATFVGPLAYQSNGADVDNGGYWYVRNNGDILQKFYLDTIVSEMPVCDIDPGRDGLNSFGDIAFKPGTTSAIGSTIDSTPPGDPSGRRVFSMHVDESANTCASTTLCTASDADCAHTMQLAYGSNGKLYGHRTNDGVFYEIDEATGRILGVACSCDVFLNDLASGPQCKVGSETAWGDGDRFTRRGNWATYIPVTVE